MGSAESSTDSIRRVLWRGGSWSKRRLSEETGVSLAMSSLVLNAMDRAGEVLASKQSNGRAGRDTQVYRIDEGFKPVLCVRVELCDGGWLLTGDVVSTLGSVLASHGKDASRVTPADLAAFVRACLEAHPEAHQVALGIPGNLTGDRVHGCDARELDGPDTLAHLRELGRPVLATNDAHAMALGCYREMDDDSDVISVAFFPEGAMPGMATVYRGVVLRGSSDFAGMLGYVPYEEGAAGNRAIWRGRRGQDLAARSLAALVAAVNPATVLCSGSLIDACAVEAMAARLADWIPSEHLPRLLYRETLTDLYVQGLLEAALAARLAGG